MIKIDTTITAGLIQVFTGLTHSYFQRLANRLAPIWEKAERIRLLNKNREREIGGGSKYKLNTIEAKLFFYLLYCRHYVNQRVIAGLCGLNQSNISRLFERIEKLIAQAADPQMKYPAASYGVSKNQQYPVRGEPVEPYEHKFPVRYPSTSSGRTEYEASFGELNPPPLKTFLDSIKEKREREGLSFAELKMLYPEIEKVITDVTEIRCNRPKNKEHRKNKTSGKKKQYSLKKQVSITKNKHIIAISKTYPGKVHDFNIEKQEAMIGKMPKETYQPVDLGYLGINKLYPKHYVITPPKKTKNGELSTFLKDLKKAHSRRRIPIEHVFASLKKFNILKNYRGRDARFDHVFDNIAAINNLCLGLT